MYAYRLSTAANRDLIEILGYTETNFGMAQRRRYQVLVAKALRNICADPGRHGLQKPGEVDGLMTYHFRHASRTGKLTSLPVRNPRHLLAFRFDGPGRLLVVRVLHDSMDIQRHVGNDN